MTEVEKFYKSFSQEIVSRQLASEDGDTQEQAFTRYVTEMLSDDVTLSISVKSLIGSTDSVNDIISSKISGFISSNTAEFSLYSWILGSITLDFLIH